jgi:hypothetical protein
MKKNIETLQKLRIPKKELYSVLAFKTFKNQKKLTTDFIMNFSKSEPKKSRIQKLKSMSEQLNFCELYPEKESCNCYYTMQLATEQWEAARELYIKQYDEVEARNKVREEEYINNLDFYNNYQLPIYTFSIRDLPQTEQTNKLVIFREKYRPNEPQLEMPPNTPNFPVNINCCVNLIDAGYSDINNVIQECDQTIIDLINEDKQNTEQNTDDCVKFCSTRDCGVNECGDLCGICNIDQICSEDGKCVLEETPSSKNNTLFIIIGVVFGVILILLLISFIK